MCRDKEGQIVIEQRDILGKWTESHRDKLVVEQDELFNEVSLALTVNREKEPPME